MLLVPLVLLKPLVRGASALRVGAAKEDVLLEVVFVAEAALAGLGCAAPPPLLNPLLLVEAPFILLVRLTLLLWRKELDEVDEMLLRDEDAEVVEPAGDADVEVPAAAVGTVGGGTGVSSLAVPLVSYNLCL